GFLKETGRADYFSQALLRDGPYPMHCAFMLTRKLATQGFVPRALIGPGVQRPDINYSYLLVQDGLDRYEPREPEARSMFRRFVTNSFRMNLWLLTDDLEKRRSVSVPKEPLAQQIRLIGAYLAK